MGRKPIKKHRKSDLATTEEWIRNISPVFLQKGFRDFTMDEVVQLAGVSKATFYKYYSSREKLIDDIIAFKLHEIAAFKEQLFDEKESFYDRFINAIRVAAMAISQISTQFLADLKFMFPKKWNMIDDFKTYALVALQSFYESGIKEGYLVDANPKVMVMMDKVFFENLTDPKFLESYGLTIHEAFTSYFRIKTEGIIKKKKGLEKIKKKIQVIEH